MRSARTLPVVLAILMGVSACAADDHVAIETGPAAGDPAAGGPVAGDPAAGDPAVARLTGTSDLPAVIEACAATASAEQDGAVILAGRLWDSNADATLDQPCVILLEGSSEIRLSNIRLAGATLNIIDHAAGAASNRVALTNVTYQGRADAGLLIELFDPGDRITVTSSHLTLPRGIVLHAAGLRDPADDGGGSVRIRGSHLAVPDEDGAGIRVLASEYGGEVSITGTQVESPGGLIALAERCQVQLRGEAPMSCASADVADDLARQAERIAAER